MLEPRPYQLEAEQAIWDYFASGKKGNPLCCFTNWHRQKFNNRLVRSTRARAISFKSNSDPDSCKRINQTKLQQTYRNMAQCTIRDIFIWIKDERTSIPDYLWWNSYSGEQSGNLRAFRFTVGRRSTPDEW